MRNRAMRNRAMPRVDRPTANAQALGNMSEQEPEVADDEPLSPWEQDVATSLEALGLPPWDHKAKAATFVQGHRGLLDLDLDFPAEYLKGPAPLSYVWKRAVEEGVRVHVYADIDGKQFHLKWEQESETGPQNQPVHADGTCGDADCDACKAALHLSKALES
tara:strand:+ start:56132 stop:56617 length:486 start_codon:yes stop_codon:yes gene_type:complete